MAISHSRYIKVVMITALFLLLTFAFLTLVHLIISFNPEFELIITNEVSNSLIESTLMFIGLLVISESLLNRLAFKKNLNTLQKGVKNAEDRLSQISASNTDS